MAQERSDCGYTIIDGRDPNAIMAPISKYTSMSAKIDSLGTPIAGAMDKNSEQIQLGDILVQQDPKSFLEVRGHYHRVGRVKVLTGYAESSAEAAMTVQGNQVWTADQVAKMLRYPANELAALREREPAGAAEERILHGMSLAKKMNVPT